MRQAVDHEAERYLVGRSGEQLLHRQFDRCSARHLRALAAAIGCECQLSLVPAQAVVVIRPVALEDDAEARRSGRRGLVVGRILRAHRRIVADVEAQAVRIASLYAGNLVEHLGFEGGALLRSRWDGRRVFAGRGAEQRCDCAQDRYRQATLGENTAR
jgi:hypothetical protein